MTVDEMPVDDAINVANVIAECPPGETDADCPELALAARDWFGKCKQAGELERERQNRLSR